MSNSPSRGRTLKLYLVDGSPSGVITAELGVSSVRAVVASRTALPDLVKRDEAARTGIYILIGPDPQDPSLNLTYVGEGDQVRTRLAAHDADEKKDFFTRAALIVSKDENLTKAHGRYLESRIIAAVRNAGRAKLMNGTEPPFRGLPEPEVADMERVLDEIEVLLPVLGFDILRPAGRRPAEPQVSKLQPSAISTPHNLQPDDTARDVTFYAHIKHFRARAVERAGEFVILAGSTANANPNDSLHIPLRRKLRSLIETGILIPGDVSGVLSFTHDVSFNSPSAASSIIGGYSDSGPRSWKVEGTGQSYGDWRRSKLLP